MAGTDASEGQALWQPGEAEEDGRLREGNRHLHLAYEEEEEDDDREFPITVRTELRNQQQSQPSAACGQHTITNTQIHLSKLEHNGHLR